MEERLTSDSASCVYFDELVLPDAIGNVDGSMLAVVIVSKIEFAGSAAEIGNVDGSATAAGNV